MDLQITSFEFKPRDEGERIMLDTPPGLIFAQYRLTLTFDGVPMLKYGFKTALHSDEDDCIDDATKMLAETIKSFRANLRMSGRLPARTKPSTQILKNAVEVKTGDVGVVIQRCPHCSYLPGLGINRFQHIDGSEFKCPNCGGRFHLEVKTTVEKLIEEVKAGQRHCFMCHTHVPENKEWLQLADPTRWVCSRNCYDNYCNGADLT
jgi:transposase-like protein